MRRLRTWAIIASLLSASGCTPVEHGENPDAHAPFMVETIVFVALGLNDYRSDVGETGGRDLAQTLSWEDYLGARTIVQVYHPDSDLLVDEQYFEFSCHRTPAVEFRVAKESLHLLVNRAGQVILASIECEGPEGLGWIGDNSVGPSCEPSGLPCDLGVCGLNLIHEDPELLQLRCRDVAGNGEVGDACSFGTPGLNNGDTCTEGNACVGGVCRAFCSRPTPGSCVDQPGTECLQIPELLESGRTGICIAPE